MNKAICSVMSILSTDVWIVKGESGSISRLTGLRHLTLYKKCGIERMYSY